MSVCALVDGQYGSTGKGLIAGHIAKGYQHHVRVGAANAGHTVYTRRPGDEHCDCGVPAWEGAGQHSPGCACFKWEKHVVQQIPCAAYANPNAHLVIGPGAQISPEIFVQELRDNHFWRMDHGCEPARLIIDPRAHVITPEQIELESQSDLAARIGSTSATAREGIGQSQADRAMRDARCVQFGDFGPRGLLERYSELVGDLKSTPNCVTDDVVEQLADQSLSILLEGTQGAGLSLTTGQFPYVTSRNTTAAGLCADVGIAPTRVKRVIMVVRTFPIRVAGNSGPFWPDSREISWSEIGVDEGSERTTVTKKVRRVATFSADQVRYGAILNGATEIALTFTDYLEPSIAGETGWMAPDLIREQYPKVAEVIRQIENVQDAPVSMLGTGPHSVVNVVVT